MKTIKQIADEIGVSKQAIQQRLKKEPLASTCRPLLTMVDGKWQVPPEAETLILSTFSGSPTSSSTSVADNLPTSINTQLVDILREELNIKNAQIEALQSSLVEVTTALHEAQATANAAQALHAGTIQGQLTEKSNQGSPPITPEPKPAAAAPAPRPAASPERKRPRNAPRPANRGKGFFDWISKRI